jgi:hypothetical protein
MSKEKTMQRFMWMSAVAISCVIVGACRARQAESPYRTTATVKDIMDSMVDPSADVLWDSVATVVSATGTEERAPKTDEEWTNVRRHAIQLIEATNLLLMPGRHVARSGEKAENPEVELGPEEIENLINQDREAWTNFAHGLHDAATPALKAIDTRNVQGLLDAGEGIDTACENCHLKYWYPMSKQAAEATKKP